MIVEEFYQLLLGNRIQNILWRNGMPKVSELMPYHYLANIKAIVLASGQIIEFGEQLDPSQMRREIFKGKTDK